MAVKKFRGKIEPFVSGVVDIANRMKKNLSVFFSLSLADERVAPRRSLTVALEDRDISVVYGSRFFSGLSVKGIRRYPFEDGKSPSPEGLASIVALAAKDLRAAKAVITLVIPKAWAIIKTVDLPVTVKDNLSSVISYELDRFTPFSADHAYYDFHIVREDEDRLQIMLAAVRADLVEPYVEALRGKGFSVKNITVSLSALATLSRFVRDGNSTVFLDIHSGGYEGGLLKDGRWVSSFTGSFVSGGEAARTGAVAEEISPLVEAMKKNGRTPEVFINAAAGSWTNLPEKLRAPVRFFGDTDLKLKFSQSKENIPYTAVGGFLESLWPKAAGMNLLMKGVHRATRRPLALTIVFLAVLAALGIFYMVEPLQIMEKRMEAIDREIAARKDEVRKIERLKSEVESLESEIGTINRFKFAKPMALNLLKELTVTLPKNVWLARVRIAEPNVDIEGYAATATEIVPRLEASPHFKKVDFASPTFRDARISADRFAIKMEIEGLPEEKTGSEKKK